MTDFCSDPTCCEGSEAVLFSVGAENVSGLPPIALSTKNGTSFG